MFFSRTMCPGAYTFFRQLIISVLHWLQSSASLYSRFGPSFSFQTSQHFSRTSLCYVLLHIFSHWSAFSKPCIFVFTVNYDDYFQTCSGLYIIRCLLINTSTFPNNFNNKFYCLILEMPQPLIRICKVHLRKQFACHWNDIEELPLPVTLKYFLIDEV